MEKKRIWVLVQGLRVVGVCGFVVVCSTDGEANEEAANVDLRPVPFLGFGVYQVSVGTMLLGCGRLGT
jgi:hypothetical protein